MALTSTGKILLINMTTFNIQQILDINPQPGITFSSFILVNNHLVIAMDHFGVVDYQLSSLFEQTADPTGILVLGDCNWSLQKNQQGNIIVEQIDGKNNKMTRIFKLNRM